MSDVSSYREALETARRTVKRTIQDHLLPDAFVMRRQYYRKHGFYPDLVNPKDLSEKLLWLKLHDRSALHTQCCDKIRARDYVRMRIGAETLVPSKLISYDPADIDPEVIGAERFVIKTNHDQGGVFLCRNRDEFDWNDARENVASRLSINKYYEFREHQYKDVRPGFIVEEFIEGADSANARECKIYCFHGRPGFIQVVYDRFENRREAFYDPNWTRMHFVGPAPQMDHDVGPPESLAQMLRDAATLAEPFLFCRIDFLVGEGDRPWFGEITFHHGAGLIRFQPDAFERDFGDRIDLSRLEATRAARRDLEAAAAKSAPVRVGGTWRTAT